MSVLSGITPPSLDWSDADLPTAFQNFKKYTELVFSGPLAAKTDKEKATYLLLWLGQEGISIFQTWNLPDERKNSPAEIFKCFEKHFEPKANFRLNRFKLQKMKQLPTENVEDFMAKCRIQADKCKFSTAESEQRLIEQLILGTAHKKVQEKLLSEDETLTVDKAMNIARTYEATKAHMEAFTSATVSVDFINRKGQNKNLGSRSKADSQTKCRKCNLKYPHKGKCPAEGSTCNYCQKPNHWEAACRQKKRDNQGKQNRNRPRNRSRSRRERSSKKQI